MENNYELSFGLILHAGNAKSKALMAIEEAREYNFDEANKLLEEASQDLKQAHQIQTDLIQKEAQEIKTEVNVMLVHAQDHLTTAMIMLDQAQEFINIYQLIKQLLNKEK